MIQQITQSMATPPARRATDARAPGPVWGRPSFSPGHLAGVSSSEGAGIVGPSSQVRPVLRSRFAMVNNVAVLGIIL